MCVCAVKYEKILKFKGENSKSGKKLIFVVQTSRK